MFFLEKFFRNFVKVGRLRVIDTEDRLYRFGADADEGQDVTVTLKDRSLYWKLLVHPSLYLGEAYMDGSLEISDGTIWDFLNLCGRNMKLQEKHVYGLFTRSVIWLLQRATQWNSLRRSQQNARHHYDLARQLYESFLDSDMQYSCAYFQSAHMSLEDAQTAKRDHLAAKLLLRRNQKVLDIGSGWGGLAIDLARRSDVRVDGVTLSHEQYMVATERAGAACAQGDVRFLLKDYRTLDGQYDRIVSVGMFEHVGVPFYPVFFRKVSELLAPDGVAVIHAIGSMDGPSIGNAWIRKYIFPGGYIPALSEVLPVVEASGLVVTDIEILRLHYAETLRHWRERFLANWHTIKDLYDDRFHKMWEFYLAASEMSFRFGGLMVFQLQLARDQTAVPLTRDYIQEFERRAKASTTASRECVA